MNVTKARFTRNPPKIGEVIELNGKSFEIVSRSKKGKGWRVEMRVKRC